LATSFDKVVATRRSIRVYDRREVSDSVVREILDLARHAPTSMNGQACCFLVIRDPATKRRLAEIKNLHSPPEKRSYPADYLADAPVIVAVCVERARSFGREPENGILATAFLLLAATSRGLSGVYLSATQRDDPELTASIRDLLHIPAGIDPITLVPLGYPGAEPPAKTLRPLEEIIRYEFFDRELRSRN